MEETVTEDGDVVRSTYLFTIIPATCEVNLPLINITLLEEEEEDTPGIHIIGLCLCA